MAWTFVATVSCPCEGRITGKEGVRVRTRTELGNDAVYKLCFDGVNYKIGRASDGVSVWEYGDIWFFCVKCDQSAHLVKKRERTRVKPL